MKKLLLTTVLALATIVAMANPIGRTAAMQKAQDFMRGINQQAQLQAGATPRKAMGSNGSAPYYIFNAENNQGFVIVSGDDRSEEILGYADEGFIDVDNMPEGLSFFLEDFTDQLAGLDAAGITEPASTSTASRGPRKVMSTGRHPISPLTTSKWTQGTPFNNQIPRCNQGDDNGQRPPVGCGTCALAQMIYFWKYTHMEYDLPSYTASSSGFSGTIDGQPKYEFDFTKLKDSYSSYSSTEATNISKFLLYVFTASQSHPDNGGSSTTPYASIPNLIGKYFNYKMSYVERKNSKPYEFEDYAYNDLRQGMPVLLKGFASDGGHYFILDGYSADGFFHINWGWEGLCNGYFQLSPLSAFNHATSHAYAKLLIGYFGFRPKATYSMKPNYDPNAYEPYETVESFNLAIRTLAFCDDQKVDPSLDVVNNDNVIYDAQSGTRKSDGTFAFNDKIKMRVLVENKTNHEATTSTTRSFDTDFIIYDQNDNVVGTFGAQSGSVKNNGLYVYYYNPSQIKLPAGNGEYYLVHRSKATASTDNILHLSETKGEYCHYKAVVSNNVMTLSLVKAVEFDASKTEIIGQCAEGWRTAVRFFAKNNAYTTMQWNYTLYKGQKPTNNNYATSIDNNYMQDNKELRLEAKSSGYLEMNFAPEDKSNTLYLVNKDRGYSVVDATCKYTLKTAATQNLSLSWVIENSSGSNLYGNELHGYVRVTNNNTSAYQDLLTLMIALGTTSYNGASKYVCHLFPVNIPAGGYVDLSIDNINYTDLIDYYGGGLPNGKSLALTLCNGKGISNSANHIQTKSLTVKASIMWWDKKGKLHAEAATSSAWSVPTEAVAVSFMRAESSSWWSSYTIPSTITVNNNPNCIFYFPDDYASRLKDKNGRTVSGLNVVINGSASNDINFTDNNGAYVPITFTAKKKVSYTRNFEHGYEGNNSAQEWTTICLPFNVTKITNSAQNVDIDYFRYNGDTGKNFWLRKFYGEEFRTVYFDYPTSFEANVPYIISMPGEAYRKYGERWCLTGKNIVFSAENTQVKSGMVINDGDSFNFINNGTATKFNSNYSIYSLETPGSYFTYENSMVGNYEGFKPFRAYLTSKFTPTSNPQKSVKVAQRAPRDLYEPNANISHRFPAIKFTYNGMTYEVPAWDEVVVSDAAHTRLQSLQEVDYSTNVNSITVTNRAYCINSDEPVFETFEGGQGTITIANTNKSVSTLTYGEACDLLNLTVANNDRSVKVFDFTAPTSATTLIVPGQYNVTEGVNAGHTFTVEEIGAGTYYNNSTLKEISIPTSITKINESAFSGCSMVNKITFEGSEPPAVVGDPFAGVNKSMCAVYVPAMMVKAYRESNSLWNEFIFASPISATKKFVSFCSDVPFTTRQFNGTKWSAPNSYMMYWIDKAKNNSATELTLSATRDRETSMIPAGFGLVMKTTSEGGSGYIFMPPVGAIEKADLVADNNMLKGCIEVTPMDPIISANQDYRYYYLTNNEFHPINKGNSTNAGRAYLEMPKSLFNGEAKTVFTLDDAVTDGILLINGDEQNTGNIYDIQGRKVERTSKGIYIVNGKKVVMK